jgi:hypothetical protein
MSAQFHQHPSSPQPLMRALPPATRFPIEALDGHMARTITAIHEIVQAPLALCAPSVLAAYAVAVQPHADLVLPIGSGIVGPLSPYFLSIGESGERKSTVDRFAMEPIRLHEERLVDQHRELLAEYERAKRDGDRSILRPVEPTIIFTELTPEALIKALQHGQPSVGLFCDEGGRFIGGHAMKPDDALKTMAVLCEFHDGSVVRRERATEGAPMRLSGRRLSICLMVQMVVAQKLLGNDLAKGQGFLSRVLPSAPDSAMGTRFCREPDPVHLKALDDYKQHLMGLLAVPQPIRPGTLNELAPRRLPMSPSAKALWVRFSDEIEAELGPYGRYRPISGFAAKLAQHAGRLAAVLTLADNLDAGDIPSRYMEAGIMLARYYVSEVERLVGVASIPAPLQMAQDVLEWLQRCWKDPTISLTQLYQNGPRNIRTARVAAHAASVLSAHGWLIPMGLVKRTPVWGLAWM